MQATTSAVMPTTARRMNVTVPSDDGHTHEKCGNKDNNEVATLNAADKSKDDTGSLLPS